MRITAHSILGAALFAFPLLAPSAGGAQAEAGKASCRWMIHEPTISICVQVAARPEATEEQQRAIMIDLLRRIDELKKLATISDDLRWLRAENHNLDNAAEQERRLRTIGKISWNLCRNRNARSACRASFHPADGTSADDLGADVVLRTMQADVSFCMGLLKDSGSADVHYPERLENIAAGAARLSALLKQM